MKFSLVLTIAGSLALGLGAAEAQTMAITTDNGGSVVSTRD